MNSVWNVLLKILDEGDNKKIAAAGDDLKYWKSPGHVGNVARVMNSAKDFVTDFWK